MRRVRARRPKKPPRRRRLPLSDCAAQIIDRARSGIHKSGGDQIGKQLIELRYDVGFGRGGYVGCRRNRSCGSGGTCCTDRSRSAGCSCGSGGTRCSDRTRCAGRSRGSGGTGGSDRSRCAGRSCGSGCSCGPGGADRCYGAYGNDGVRRQRCGRSPAAERTIILPFVPVSATTVGIKNTHKKPSLVDWKKNSLSGSFLRRKKGAGFVSFDSVRRFPPVIRPLYRMFFSEKRFEKRPSFILCKKSFSVKRLQKSPRRAIMVVISVFCLL